MALNEMKLSYKKNIICVLIKKEKKFPLKEFNDSFLMAKSCTLDLDLIYEIFLKIYIIL